MTAGTPYDLLGQYPDRSRPFVTHYSGPDSRIELSVASALNAVAKASSLLRDGMGLAPGAQVSVDLPRHWQLPVWVMAGLSVGGIVGRSMPGPVDVRVVGPEGLAAIVGGADSGADEVLACSCDPFGLPVPGGVPGGVLDVGVEARAHPDQFVPEPAAGPAAALVVDGDAQPWQHVVAAGPGGVPGSGSRLWVDGDTAEEILLHAVAVQPLLLRGSVVISTGLGAEQAARIRGIEAVTGRAGR